MNDFYYAISCLYLPRRKPGDFDYFDDYDQPQDAYKECERLNTENKDKDIEYVVILCKREG